MGNEAQLKIPIPPKATTMYEWETGPGREVGGDDPVRVVIINGLLVSFYWLTVIAVFAGLGVIVYLKYASLSQ